MMKKTVSAILYKAIIICSTLPFPMKNNSLSAYGDSDICGISSNTERYFIPTYSPVAN